MRKQIERGAARGIYDVMVPDLGPSKTTTPAAMRWRKAGHVRRNNGGSSHTAYPLNGAPIGNWRTRAQAAEAVALWSAQVRV